MSARLLVLVVLQFVCAAVLVLSADVASFHAASIAVSTGGFGLSVWSVASIGLRHLSIMPHVKTEASLVTRGPYRWIRHPMYSGLILFCGGFVFAPYDDWKLLVWCFLIFVLRLKAGCEERLLAERFPEYRAYRARTRWFLPFVY